MLTTRNTGLTALCNTDASCCGADFKMSRQALIPNSAQIPPAALVRTSAEFHVAEILGALSHALDLTEGQPAGHCERACLIATRTAIEAGIAGEALGNVYFTALLKDLGCSSNAARICELYIADDISLKRDFKTLDGSLSSALRFVFNKTGIELGFAERIGAIINIVQNGGRIVDEMIEARCTRGADIAARLRFNIEVQAGIRHLDEHFDGTGRPDGLKGNAIPSQSQLALLAQIADVFFTEHGPKAARAEIAARAGTWFDPRWVAAFERASEGADFWACLERARCSRELAALAPARLSRLVDDAYIDEIAEAFCDVVDAKSPFTAGHSRRVAGFAASITETLGVEVPLRNSVRRAALLHDIGKLAVSNTILDKADKLSPAEWEAMRAHPRHSQEILQHVAVFSELAPIAGAHHERLDGKGYPWGIGGNEIPLAARIITVADVFDALTADRPYRKAMQVADALAILDREIGVAFDPDCVSALKDALQRQTVRFRSA